MFTLCHEEFCRTQTQSESWWSWITEAPLTSAPWPGREVGLTNMNTEAHTHTHTHKCTAPAHCRSCTGVHCVAQAHLHRFKRTPSPAQTDLSSHQFSKPAVKQSWKTMQGLHSHLSKERCFPYAKWFAQEGMTFLPPLRIHVSFFRVCAMYLSHNSLLASNRARMSIQQNSFKDI